MDAPVPGVLAERLYHCYVTATGYTPPDTYADLLLFVGLSGVPVLFWEHSPRGFWGLQVGAFIHLNGSDKLSDRERMLTLAHEWCHALRERHSDPPSLYLGGEEAERERDFEEQIALAFQRFF